MAELHAVASSARPGFGSGVAALPRAAGELLRTPSLWGPSLVPLLVLLALTGGFGAAAVFYARPWLGSELPQATSALGRFGVAAAGWALASVLVVLGWYLALALAPIVSAPALERIIECVEEELGVPPRARLGFARELWCGFASLAGAATLAAPSLFLLWLAGALLPAASVVTLPLGGLFGAWLVAWALFDYPLTLRGIGFRRRLALVRENLACVTGFGLAFSLIFWLPCCGVVLLPLGAIAATRLVCAILFRSPLGFGGVRPG